MSALHPPILLHVFICCMFLSVFTIVALSLANKIYYYYSKKINKLLRIQKNSDFFYDMNFDLTLLYCRQRFSISVAMSYLAD